MKFLIRFLGLKGSWKWALRQMKNGHIVRRKSFIGPKRLKLDFEDRCRIIDNYSETIDEMNDSKNWISAFLFLEDLEATDWEIFDPDNLPILWEL